MTLFSSERIANIDVPTKPAPMTAIWNFSLIITFHLNSILNYQGLN